MRKRIVSIMLLMAAMLTACQSNKVEVDPNIGSRPEDNTTVMLPAGRYELTGSKEVGGRQGVCAEGDYYWVSGSASLSTYDKDWNLKDVIHEYGIVF